MALLSEGLNKRLISPDAFKGAYRHPCLGCGAELVIPDPTSGRTKLEDGDIWACTRCRMAHEYYLAFGDGSRSGVMRALVGLHRYDPGEPTVGEFVEGDK